MDDKVGTGSTDFWGISFSPSALEQEPMGDAELERRITLLRACWAFFDGIAARVSPVMAKGPRGGGRDRDDIIRHLIRVESQDFAAQVGLQIAEGLRAASAKEAADRSGALTPDLLRDFGRPMSRRCGHTTPARSRSGCARGTCHSSSDIRPSTRSTMPGRWRTRTLQRGRMTRCQAAGSPIRIGSGSNDCWYRIPDSNR